MIRMHDLAAADPALRFSPYCWRTRFALAHKGLEAEALPWRFAEKARLPPPYERVPVIEVDEEGAEREVVGDSWAIACWLEDRYPDRPSLFGGPVGRAHARFHNAWADAALNPLLARILAHDIWTLLDPGDRDHFRRTREARFGATLEALHAERERHLPVLRATLAPLRAVLEAQPWLGGAGPDYADHIVAGSLQWARCVATLALPELDEAPDASPVSAWFGRVLDLYGGLGRAARTR